MRSEAVDDGRWFPVIAARMRTPSSIGPDEDFARDVPRFVDVVCQYRLMLAGGRRELGVVDTSYPDRKLMGFPVRENGQPRRDVDFVFFQVKRLDASDGAM